MPHGFAIWLTGLPASGKTTIASALSDRLRDQGLLVEMLDGDEVRRSLSADLGFSPEDRQRHNQRIIYISKLLVRNGVVVLIPLISPYRVTRALARQELSRFLEVYVKCPVEECIKRDPKGLYAKALRGEVPDFTGISAPYEAPEHPEVVVETDVLPLAACVDEILDAATVHGYLLGTSSDGGVPVDRKTYREEVEQLAAEPTTAPD